MSRQSTVIGIGSRNYGYRRVAYDVPVECASFRKVAYVPWKFLTPGDPRWANMYLFRPSWNVDLYHLWNGVCLNQAPWITSFEARLPRYGGMPRDRLYNIAIDRIHRRNCKGLLALSDYARHFFVLENQDLIDDSVLRKLHVFSGILEIDDALVESHRAFIERDTDDFVLCMVGHLFFQKGGIAVLDAFRRLKASIPRIKLVVISRLLTDTWVTNTSTAAVDQVKEELRSDDMIEWYEQCPHERVVEFLASSDVALLPSLDDTLGWSVLEAMSLGLPVITTNVCALPEMVHHKKTGWSIELPLQANRRWIGLSRHIDSPERTASLEAAYEAIAAGIREAVVTIYSNGELAREMRTNAIEHVRRHHDPNLQATILGRHYDSCLE